MAEKTLHTRVIQKHDTKSNWDKATNFIPKQGEIIVYDDLKQIKIGDGATKASTLPFLSTDTEYTTQEVEDMWLEIFGDVPEVSVTIPEEYQKVSYIQTSGTQYINTGILAASSAIEVTMQLSGTSGTQGMLGARQTTGAAMSSYNLFYGVTAGKIRVDWTGVSTTNVDVSSNTDLYMYLYENGAVNINNVVYPSKGIKTLCDYPLFIGTFNNVGSAYSPGVSAKWKSVKIYTSSIMVRHFVPCYRKSDNVIGMYDTITKTFFTNAGSGTFGKGGNI